MCEPIGEAKKISKLLNASATTATAVVVVVIILGGGKNKRSRREDLGEYKIFRTGRSRRTEGRERTRTKVEEKDEVEKEEEEVARRPRRPRGPRKAHIRSVHILCRMHIYRRVHFRALGSSNRRKTIICIATPRR